MTVWAAFQLRVSQSYLLLSGPLYCKTVTQLVMSNIASFRTCSSKQWKHVCGNAEGQSQCLKRKNFQLNHDFNTGLTDAKEVGVLYFNRLHSCSRVEWCGDFRWRASAMRFSQRGWKFQNKVRKPRKPFHLTTIMCMCFWFWRNCWTSQRENN